MAGDVSDESEMFKALGTVMNFEPSLFVYFAVAFEVGDVGDCTVCWRGFAGIPIRCRLNVGASTDGNCSQHKRLEIAQESSHHGK
jgi:hypothetical protein